MTKKSITIQRESFLKFCKIVNKKHNNSTRRSWEKNVTKNPTILYNKKSNYVIYQPMHEQNI